MPLLAYFWKVGAALLALLFMADFWLSDATIALKASVDRPTIRIQSDRKWPERVILDTSVPTIVAAMPETARVETATSTAQAEPPLIRTETPVIANALAMVPTDQPAREAVDRKRQLEDTTHRDAVEAARAVADDSGGTTSAVRMVWAKILVEILLATENRIDEGGTWPPPRFLNY
jgi:hypothetical protein